MLHSLTIGFYEEESRIAISKEVEALAYLLSAENGVQGQPMHYFFSSTYSRYYNETGKRIYIKQGTGSRHFINAQSSNARCIPNER